MAILMLFHLFLNTALAVNNIYVVHWTQDELKTWEVKQFKGKTQYSVRIRDKKDTLLSESTDSAAGLIKKMKVDLTKTPFLNWSWAVDKLLEKKAPNSEKTKAGDDFPARIYVIVSGGMLFWKTLALNYVWAEQNERETYWPNPFTANAVMYAIESGTTNLGKFISYKRNVRDDLKKTFARDFSEIDGVAIMTDTDNTHSSATAYYGDIFFSSN